MYDATGIRLHAGRQAEVRSISVIKYDYPLFQIPLYKLVNFQYLLFYIVKKLT